jgi:WD40 repeat protein
VEISSASTRHAFTGPGAPLTSLALSVSTGSSQDVVLYAGCWDRSIWSWNVTSRARGVHFRSGHRDFVKTVAWTRLSAGLAVLISGSADTSIIIWDAANGSKLQTLNGHSMAVACLVVDPAEPDDEDAAGGKASQLQAKTLFSASARSILQWSLIATPQNPLGKLTAAPSPHVEGPLTPHEGPVYALTFGAVTKDDPEPDLWSAGADGTVVSLARDDEWSVSEKLTTAEGHHVRCIARSEDGRWIAAAGRDEDVWAWDMRSGAAGADIKLLPKFEGHFDEILGLAILGKGMEAKIVSCSLDGTIRTWPVASAFPAENAEDEDWAADKHMAGQALDNSHLFAGNAEETGGTSEAVFDDAIPVGLVSDVCDVHLTNEEQAELDALMDDGGDPFG